MVDYDPVRTHDFAVSLFIYMHGKICNLYLLFFIHGNVQCIPFLFHFKRKNLLVWVTWNLANSFEVGEPHSLSFN